MPKYDFKDKPSENERLRKSPLRFVWLAVPFAFLGIAVFVSSLFMIPAYRNLDPLSFFFYVFGYPLALGHLGSRYAIRCLCNASFRGNGRKDVRIVFGLLLGLWSAALLFAGTCLSYLISRGMTGILFGKDVPVKFRHFVEFFCRVNPSFAGLILAEMVIVVVFMVVMIRNPYRLPV